MECRASPSRPCRWGVMGLAAGKCSNGQTVDNEVIGMLPKLDVGDIIGPSMTSSKQSTAAMKRLLHRRRWSASSVLGRGNAKRHLVRRICGIMEVGRWTTAGEPIRGCNLRHVRARQGSHGGVICLIGNVPRVCAAASRCHWCAVVPTSRGSDAGGGWGYK